MVRDKQDNNRSTIILNIATSGQATALMHK